MSNLIKARRRLDEIYKTGVEARVGGRYGLTGELATAPSGKYAGQHVGPFLDEDGKPVPLMDDEVSLWIQPPSPIQRDMALRNANAARSRASMAARRDPESEEHLAALEFIGDMDEDTVYDYLLVAKTADRQQEALREILAEEEWADITEMQDSLRIFQEEGRGDDDPEVKLIAKRERELQVQVAAREDELRDAARDVMKMRGEEHARKQAIEHHIEILCSRAFMIEYERQMTYFAVRDGEDHKMLFFESARELSEQGDDLLDLIQLGIAQFIKDGTEAKNSPRAASGSGSSAPPSKPATSELFTPQDASA